MKTLNNKPKIGDVFYQEGTKKVIGTNKKGKLIIINYPERHF